MSQVLPRLLSLVSRPRPETLLYRPETLTAEGLRGFFADVFVTLDAHPRELDVRVELTADRDAIIDLADGNPVFDGVPADFRRRWIAEHPVPLVLKAGRTTRIRFVPTDKNRVKVRWTFPVEFSMMKFASVIPQRERRAIRQRAFVDSLPVLMGYTTMGFVAGVLLGAKGGLLLAPIWAFLSSALWVTGTMSIAGVPEIARHASCFAFALMTLMVNFRYAFYGFSMLDRWKNVPFPHKAYLILMLTDENYALEYAHKARDPAKNLYYCTALSVMNHSYWIVGLTFGAIVVAILGHVIDPVMIRRCTNGMEFSMAALFIVILTDQIRSMWKSP